jgi:putative intracellular protease/amidase
VSSILFILSGAREWTQVDGLRRPAGLSAEELAAPHRAFKRAGCAIAFASPDGRPAAVNPRSRLPEVAGPDSPRHARYLDAIAAEFAHPLKLADVDVSGYDAVVIPGGRAPMEDLYRDAALGRLLVGALTTGKIISAVCHGPAGLLSTVDRTGGWPFAGFRMVSVTDEEERLVGTAAKAPWLLEAQLRKYGAHFDSGPPWQRHVVRDGQLITGQNPASSGPLAEAVLAALD